MVSNILYFCPYLKNDPNWRAYFSNGLKPPPSLGSITILTRWLDPYRVSTSDSASARRTSFQMVWECILQQGVVSRYIESSKFTFWNINVYKLVHPFVDVEIPCAYCWDYNLITTNVCIFSGSQKNMKVSLILSFGKVTSTRNPFLFFNAKVWGKKWLFLSVCIVAVLSVLDVTPLCP